MKKATKAKILEILDAHRIMTVATVRPDGWPQATTVGYVNEGLVLFFLCSRDSQKAANIACDERVAITIDRDVTDPLAISGLSIAACAKVMSTPEEIAKVLKLLAERYPEYVGLPPPDFGKIYVMRVIPRLISILDYSKGFGHTELVKVDRDDLAVPSPSAALRERAA